MREFACILFVVSWLAGIVLAKGFWLTVLAIVFPFYGFYLIVERGMQMAGII